MNKLIIVLKKTITVFLIFLFLAFCNYTIYKFATHKQIYYHVDELKSYHKLLILGAGRKNPVFNARMNAAMQLYHNCSIKKITCSGMTGFRHYTEPNDMQEFLLSNHVPDSIIQLDSSGNSTLTSVVNYALQHKGDSVIIVSQAQHLNRALFIANCKGLQAVGFAASGFGGDYNNDRRFIEFLSRIKSSFFLIF